MQKSTLLYNPEIQEYNTKASLHSGSDLPQKKQRLKRQVSQRRPNFSQRSYISVELF